MKYLINRQQRHDIKNKARFKVSKTDHRQVTDNVIVEIICILQEELSKHIQAKDEFKHHFNLIHNLNVECGIDFSSWDLVDVKSERSIKRVYKRGNNT